MKKNRTQILLDELLSFMQRPDLLGFLALVLFIYFLHHSTSAAEWWWMNGWKGRQIVRQMELRGEINNVSEGVSGCEKRKRGHIIIKRGNREERAWSAQGRETDKQIEMSRDREKRMSRFRGHEIREIKAWRKEEEAGGGCYSVQCLHAPICCWTCLLTYVISWSYRVRTDTHAQ